MGFISVAKRAFSAAKLAWKAWHLICDIAAYMYLRPIYEKSHAIYLRHHQLGSFWHPLGDLLEVSIETVNMFTKELGREPGIALRTKSTVTSPVKMARLLVQTAKREELRQETLQAYDIRQETLQAYDIGHEPVKLKLTNMPFEDLVNNGETFEPTIFKISVKLLEICYLDVSHILNQPSEIHLYPTYMDHLNGTWVRRWGQVYNLDEWVSERQDLVDLIEYALLQPHEKLDLPRMRHTPWGAFRRAIARLLTSNHALTFLFSLLVIKLGVENVRKGLGLHEPLYRASPANQPFP